MRSDSDWESAGVWRGRGKRKEEEVVAMVVMGSGGGGGTQRVCWVWAGWCARQDPDNQTTGAHTHRHRHAHTD